MKKRDVLNSPRLLELKKRRRRVVLNKILLSFFALALIFAGLVYISRISSLNIKSIEIVGNKVLDTESVKAAAEKELAGNYFWFFPKTNILFYPKNILKNKLHNEFKRLKDINLSVKNTKILEISVTERVASYVWCGDIPPQPGSGDKTRCNFLDNFGYMFDEAAYFSGDVYFKFYGADLAKSNFEKLISFKKTLETMELKPTAIYLQNNGNIKIFLSTKNSGGIEPYIIFQTNSDFESVAENLQVALSTEPLKSSFKNKYSSMEYIDLRFGNKVYYKFR